MVKQCHTEFTSQRKELLENSMLGLLSVRRYQDISVKDICQEAQIPRRTFYHYFQSKEDVLDSIVEGMIMDCFLEAVVELDVQVDRIKESFVQIFRFWQNDNRRKLDILLHNSLESKLITHALNWVHSEDFRIAQAYHPDPKMVEIGIMVGVSDFFSLLLYWSRNGYQESPEKMAEYAVWVLPRIFTMS